MQKELDADYPELEIQILSINHFRHEISIPGYTEGRDLPVLQDVDNDSDGRSDVWTAWNVELWDVVILDHQNVEVDVFVGQDYPLTDPANYAALRQQLVDTARDEQCLAGDSNRDGIFDSGDLVYVLAAGEYEDEIEGNSTWDTGDWNHDHEFDSSDLITALACGKYQYEEDSIAVVPIFAGDRVVSDGDRVDRYDQMKEEKINVLDVEPASARSVDMELRTRDRIFGDWAELDKSELASPLVGEDLQLTV